MKVSKNELCPSFIYKPYKVNIQHENIGKLDALVILAEDKLLMSVSFLCRFSKSKFIMGTFDKSLQNA